MMRSYREGTLIFKDLIFPQWWLDWIIPSVVAGDVPAGSGDAGHIDQLPDKDVPVPHEQVPGIRPEELP